MPGLFRHPPQPQLSPQGRFAPVLAPASVDNTRTAGDSLGTSYSAMILADSPTSYWRLGESTPGTGTATDQRGAHDGTYANSPTSTTGLIAGDADTAVDFTGSSPSRYVSVTGYTTIPATGSLEAWVSTASASDMGLCGWWSSAALQWFLYLRNADQIVFACGTEANALTYDTAGALNSGNHHIVGTYDGTYGRLYFDGSLVAGPTTFISPGGTSTYPFKIATYGNNYTANFAGIVDEVAVYDGTVLSSTQVTAHAAGTGGGGITEAATRLKGLPRTGADSIGTLSEAAGRAGVFARTVAGSTIGTLSEAAVRIAARARTGADSLGSLSEVAIRAAMAKARTAGDAIGSLAEAAVRAFVGSRAVGDAISALSEIVVGVKSGATAFTRTAGDAIGTLAESAARGTMSVVRSAGDALGSLSEAAVRIAARARTAADSVGSLSEVAVRAAAAKMRTGADSVGSLSETAVRAAMAKVRTAGDAVGSLTEAVTRAAMALVRTAGDALSTLTEAVVGVKAGAHAFVRSVADAIATLTEEAVLPIIGGFPPRAVAAVLELARSVVNHLRPSGSATTPTPDGEARHPKPRR